MGMPRIAAIVTVTAALHFGLAGSCTAGLVSYHNFDNTTSDQAGLLLAYDASLQNGATYSTDAPGVGGSHSLSLDGSDDFVKVEHIMRPQAAYTYSFWFKPNSTLNSSSPRMDFVYGLKEASTNERSHFTFNRAGDGTIRDHAQDRSSQFDVSSTTNTWSADWHHFAATFDGTDYRVFVDGKLERTLNRPGMTKRSKGLNVGANNLGSNNVAGLMDEVAVFSTALSFQVDGSGNLTGGELYELFTGGAAGFLPSDTLKVNVKHDTTQVQAGYRPFVAGPDGRSDTLTPGKTFPEFGVFTATITDAAGGGIDVRKRASGIPGQPQLHQMLRDGVKDTDGGLKMTLSGLEEATYELTTFHHDAAYNRDHTDIFVTDADHPTETQVVDDLDPITGTGDTPFAYATVRFRSNGLDPVVFRYTDASETFLNGFVLEKVSGEPGGILFQEDFNDTVAHLDGSDPGRLYTTSRGPQDGNTKWGERADDTTGEAVNYLWGSEGADWFYGQSLDDVSGGEAITFDSVSVSGYRDIQLKLLLAASSDENGESGPWESSDFLIVEAALDGGAFQELLHFTGPASGGDTLRDLDVDGQRVDLARYFQEFTFDLAASSSVQVRIRGTSSTTDEAFGIDDVRITGIVPEPGTFVLFGLGAIGLLALWRRRP